MTRMLFRLFSADRSLPDICEFARRFSGVVAIAVLAAAMVSLVLHSDDQHAPEGNATSRSPYVRDSSTTVPPVRSLTGPAATTIVYYLYATPEQEGQIYDAETRADEEVGPLVDNRSYEFKTIEASSPESERRARDLILAALLASPSGTRIVVKDVRGE